MLVHSRRACSYEGQIGQREKLLSSAARAFGFEACNESPFGSEAWGAAREPSTSKRNKDALSSLAEKRLADDMTDAYVDWREERAAVWLAYDGWTSAPTADAAAAFAVYRAALDREERAAEVYGRLVMQLAAGTSLTFNS